MGHNLIAANITSFGYRHGPPPPALLTVDVRAALRDPHTDPAMRELTGLHHRVRRHVYVTPGASRLVTTTADLVAGMLADVGDPTGVRVDVAIGCAGGRHRSVALAELLAVQLGVLGHRTAVIHRDVALPVLPAAS